MAINLDQYYTTGVVPSGVVGQRGKERLRQYQQRTPGMVVRYGFPDLDKFYMLGKGRLDFLSARPGVGKTTLAMQVMELASRETGLPIVFFSAEMDAATIALREACARCKVTYWSVVSGRASDEEYERVNAQLDAWTSMNIILDETNSPTLQHITEQLHAVQEAHGSIGLVVFDYMGLAGGFEGDERSKADRIAKGLKAIAKKFDTAVLAIVQTNRGGESEGEPTMAEIMFGGEQVADGIMILRKRVNDYGQTLIDCYVVKHRHGPTGQATIGYLGDTMRFVSIKQTRKEIESGEERELTEVEIRKRMERTAR